MYQREIYTQAQHRRRAHLAVGSAGREQVGLMRVKVESSDWPLMQVISSNQWTGRVDTREVSTWPS